MQFMTKITVSLVMVTVPWVLVNCMALAYEDGSIGETVVEGIITFIGQPPPPRIIPLFKEFEIEPGRIEKIESYPDARYCLQFDSDGKGNRVQYPIKVNNDRLQDVVVYISDISKGKPFFFEGTDVRLNNCRFLVQGGPSTFVGVVVKGTEFRVWNDDDVLQNVHTYNIYESRSRTIFNKPLPSKGSKITYKIEPIDLARSNIMFMQGDQRSFLEAWFYAVENPYYAIVGPEGTYSINQVPAGKYKIIAWHPMLGEQEKDFEVKVTGNVIVNFEFSSTNLPPRLKGSDLKSE